MSRCKDLFSCYDSLSMCFDGFSTYGSIISFNKWFHLNSIRTNDFGLLRSARARYQKTNHHRHFYSVFFLFYFEFVGIKMKTLHNPICCSTYPSGERNHHLIMKQTDSKFIYNFLFMIFINVLNHSNRYFIHEQYVGTSECQYSRNIWIGRARGIQTVTLSPSLSVYERQKESWFVFCLVICALAFFQQQFWTVLWL